MATAQSRSRTKSRRSSSRSNGRGQAALAAIARQMSEEAESRSADDAIELLEQDHREVEDLLEQFEQADENTEKQELARKICVALTVHAELEETKFYPKVRKALDEADLVDEAEVEHATAKQLIGEIERMTPRDKLFDAKVKVLGEYVKHHVREEEGEMFPQVRDSDLDLERMAEDMTKQRIKILQKLMKQ